MVFLKKLKSLFLYLIYNLVQIFMILNRTDIKLISKYGKRVVLIFSYRLHKSFSHSFLADFPSLVMQ